MSFSPQKGFIKDSNAPQFHQLSGWLVSDDPAGEEAGCGGAGLLWLDVLPFSKITLEAIYGREIIPAVSMPIACSCKT